MLKTSYRRIDREWRIPIAVFLLTFFLSLLTYSQLAILPAVYAGYRSRAKAVLSQAIGTGLYVSAIYFLLTFRPAGALFLLLCGYGAKRYAVYKHPLETFRKPIDGAPGYYYNPMRVGASDKAVIRTVSIASYFVPIRFFGTIATKLLRLLAGMEIEPGELQERDPMYYLHSESEGYVFSDGTETEPGHETKATVEQN